MTKPSSWQREVFKNYQAPLLRYAKRIFTDARAEDLVQFAFLKLFEETQIKEIVHVKAWLFKVVRNRGISLLRSEAKYDFLIDPESIQEEDSNPEGQYLKKEIFLNLEKLRSEEKEIVLLKFEDGFTYDEISRITGKTKSNVGVILSRSISKLGDMMKEENHYEE